MRATPLHTTPRSLFGRSPDLNGQQSLPLDYPQPSGGVGGDSQRVASIPQTMSEPVLTGEHHPRSVKPETRQQYLGYVKTLQRQYLRSLPQLPEQAVRPIDLVDYLITRAPTLRPKTCSSYRAGLLYWINSLPDSEDTHHARLVLQVGLPKQGYKGRKANQTATLYSRQSQRPRTFSQRRFQVLLAELNRRAARAEDGRNRAMELLFWLQAGLGSGLRPAEWERARWVDDTHTQILVTTAKRKTDHNALPHIAERPIAEEKHRIVHVDPEYSIWVDQHLACVRNHLLQGEPFSRYYNNNRIYLWAVCQELFPEDTPKFTLYLMRGQFSANRKRRGQPAEDLAAEMGSSVKVIQTSYGAKRHGHHHRGQHESVQPTQAPRAPAPNQALTTPVAVTATPRFSFGSPGRAGR